MAAPSGTVSRARHRGLGSHDHPIGTGDVDITEAWLIEATDPADTPGGPNVLSVIWTAW